MGCSSIKVAGIFLQLTAKNRVERLKITSANNNRFFAFILKINRVLKKRVFRKFQKGIEVLKKENIFISFFEKFHYTVTIAAFYQFKRKVLKQSVIRKLFLVSVKSLPLTLTLNPNSNSYPNPNPKHYSNENQSKDININPHSKSNPSSNHKKDFYLRAKLLSGVLMSWPLIQQLKIFNIWVRKASLFRAVKGLVAESEVSSYINTG
jgi:hypothetical protein